MNPTTIAITSLELAETLQRNSGRTERMLQLVKPGDVIIVNCHDMQSYIVNRLEAIYGVKIRKQIDVIVVSPKQNIDPYIFKGKTYKEIHLEHYWQHLRLIEIISHSFDDIESLKKLLTKPQQSSNQHSTWIWEK